MKKRPLLLIILVIITTLTLFAFPGAGSATDYVPNTTHTHYCIISSPFNKPITIEKNYNNYADALSAAKNMAHVAMYRADVQSKIATLTNEGFINYLYDGLFHRTPEEAGFAGWLFGLNEGLSRSSMIDYFINSPEFEMRYVYGYSMPPTATLPEAPLVVPAGPNASQDAPTGLAGVAPTTYDGTNGSITGTTTAMEYKLSTDSNYTTATDTSITGLAAGTYNVRYAPKTGFDAGATAAVTVPAGVLKIGDSYGGGIIAYILQPGETIKNANGDTLSYNANVQHGLIAATTDQSTEAGIRWYNGSYTITGATGILLGTGFANTTTIITAQGPTATSYAAGLARAHNGGGFTDWFLPSKDELNKLYLKRDMIGGFDVGSNPYYWSSTEYDNTNARTQNFGTGIQGGTGKTTANHVRAVRVF